MKIVNGKFKRGYSNAIGRWAAVGPYYAMFPLEFAFNVVHKHSEPGQFVLDPFAGRASSVFAAATHKRRGIGIEIHPVGWVYAQAKLNPAPLPDVEKRLESIIEISKQYQGQSKELPQFFSWCYSGEVLKFLVAARDNLKWWEDQVDSTLMALLLIYLHARLGQGLSNQMRQTKAMAPDYSIRWWQKKGMDPPKIDCHEFLLKRIQWRYAKGHPETTPESEVHFGDSTKVLDNIVDQIEQGSLPRCSLLFTSPPYCGVTDYHVDQWLRLWLLGDEPSPKRLSQKYSSAVSYRDLLDSVFGSVAQIMSSKSTIYVRTSARDFTLDTTTEILQKYFPEPKWKKTIKPKPFEKETQTSLFGDFQKKPGEMDIILTLG